VADTMLPHPRFHPGPKEYERIIMTIAAFADIEELDELYKLNLTETPPEGDEEDDGDDDDEDEPEVMPQG
jgi:hypothetical protein